MKGERLGFRIGPFRWCLTAHDAEGCWMLDALARNLRPSRFRPAAHRSVHLLSHPPGSRYLRETAAGRLPRRLASLTAEPLPAAGWSFEADDCGYLSLWHPSSRHAFLVRGPRAGERPARFWLPWAVLELDAVALGGGVLHGGLAAHGGRAFVVTAPPGGGKTTALGRLPAPWEVHCDDACLVWPKGGRFLASPLPTYGVMLGNRAAPGLEGPWDTSRRFEVAGVLLLRKARRARLRALEPIAAARPLYLALSEHPGVLPIRDGLRERLFRTACALSRAVPSHILETTRTGSPLPPPEELLPRG